MLIALVLPAAGLAACSDDGGSSAHADRSSPTSSASPSRSAAVPGSVDDHTTVAIVNGHKIKGAAFNRMLAQVHTQDLQQQMQQGQGAPGPSEKQEKKQAIDTVVGTELLVQEAEARGYKAPKKTVDQQMSQVHQQYPSTKKLRRALKQSHITLKQLRAEITDRVKIQAYVNKELGPFTVTRTQIKAYYAQLKKQAGSGGGKNSLPPLKKVRPQIKQQLQSEKQQQKVSSQVAKLKKKGHVDILI